MREIRRTFTLAKNISLFIIFIWGVFILNMITPSFDFNQFGIVPRTLSGLIGIICSPFLHANILHIISNTIPLFVLSFLLFLFYRKYAFGLLVSLILLSGSLVWLFARPACHIGASGLIYALAAFIITSGIYSRKFTSIILSIVVVLVYGGLIFGIFPTQVHISWEGHLFGAISGIFISYLRFNNAKGSRIRKN